MPSLSLAPSRMWMDVVDPTVNEDGENGYEIGNWWLNTVSNNLFQCLGIDTGNALWQITPSSLNGTWTPSLSFGGSSDGIVYNSQMGEYTVIGNIVYINAFLHLVSKGTSQGNASIRNLPFAARSGISPKGLQTIYQDVALTPSYIHLYGRINQGSSQINLVQTADSFSVNILNANQLNFSNNSIIQVDGFYFI